MAHFFRPATAAPGGYDVDGRLAPDSVWRVWIPLPGSREIGLYGGRSLWVRSSNEGIVRNDGTGIIRREDQAPDITYLTVRPISAGHCELQAGLGPSIWIALDVNAGAPRADANLYLASQVGKYDNVDATAATRNFRNGKPGIELLGGASRGWMRWLEVRPGMAVREASGPPAVAKPIQASNIWISYSNRPSLLVIRMGWTFKYTDTEELRYYYLEIWWLPADDREYLVLQSHAIRAGYGDQIGFGMVLRPWCGDAGLKRQMMIEFGELLPGLLVGLVAAGIWRASIWRKSSVKAPKTTPLNGKVSVGGGFENTDGTNLNPVTHDDSGGPARDIPNHVLGRMEDMDQLFEPASVKLMISSKLRFQDVDWTRGTQAAARVMAPGGKVLMNVYAVYTDTDEEALRSAFVSAGFKNVQVKGDPPGTMVFATFGP